MIKRMQPDSASLSQNRRFGVQSAVDLIYVRIVILQNYKLFLFLILVTYCRLHSKLDDDFLTADLNLL